MSLWLLLRILKHPTCYKQLINLKTQLMKNIFLFSALFIFSKTIVAQEQTLQITPVVQSVVIYLNGAELSQKKEINLKTSIT